MADQPVNAFADPYWSRHLAQPSHGTETCPDCGGYQRLLGVPDKHVSSICRDCGKTSVQAKGNDLPYWLNATAADYE